VVTLGYGHGLDLAPRFRLSQRLKATAHLVLQSSFLLLAEDRQERESGTAYAQSRVKDLLDGHDVAMPRRPLRKVYNQAAAKSP
jgi:hypothetical protein